MKRETTNIRGFETRLHPVEGSISPTGTATEALEDLAGAIVLVKYGGNAMVDEGAKQAVVDDICALQRAGVKPVVVHGGGPAISELLDSVGLVSTFADGHRITDRQAMGYVEMALSGKVNKEIVKRITLAGGRAVGISGKDGGLATARKREHTVRNSDGTMSVVDLGQVGDITSIDTELVEVLLDAGYIPVIAPIGVAEDGDEYNINADMFAGHVAAALRSDAYLVLTNVDGIYTRANDPSSLIRIFTAHQARGEIGKAITGGMIPKVESCLIALEGGAGEAHIINGLKEHAILDTLLAQAHHGTTLREHHAA